MSFRQVATAFPSARLSVPRDSGPVSIRHLTKRFGDTLAVDDVNLEVQSGEFLALLGPSGSGKTTILMCVAGFDFPDAGSIRIGERDITWVPPHQRGLGMVFQRYTLFPHMSVLENIAFPLRMRKVPRLEREMRARAALETVRLGSLGDRRPSQLSGGQQQRVALARAIVYNPQVLLMDEPLSALDKNLREEMQIEIKHLQRELGVTVIFVTHDQAEALTMADRITILNHGQLQQIGTPRDLYETPQTEFVARFIGDTNFWPGVTCQAAVTGAKVTVELDGGVIAHATAAANIPIGTAIRLAVRPERITLDGDVEATMQEAIYTGNATTLAVSTAGPPLRVLLPAGAGFIVPAIGASLSIGWASPHAHVFPILP